MNPDPLAVIFYVGSLIISAVLQAISLGLAARIVCTRGEQYVARRLSTPRRAMLAQPTDLSHGMTRPQAIVEIVRKDMVGRYLEDPNRPLHLLAQMLGFSAWSAFSRWFRNCYGCSPSPGARRWSLYAEEHSKK